MSCDHKTKAHIVQCPSLNQFHSPAEQVTVLISIGSIIQEQKNLLNPQVKPCDLVNIALGDRDSVIVFLGPILSSNKVMCCWPSLWSTRPNTSCDTFCR